MYSGVEKCRPAAFVCWIDYFEYRLETMIWYIYCVNVLRLLCWSTVVVDKYQSAVDWRSNRLTIYAVRTCGKVRMVGCGLTYKHSRGKEQGLHRCKSQCNPESGYAGPLIGKRIGQCCFGFGETVIDDIFSCIPGLTFPCEESNSWNPKCGGNDLKDTDYSISVLFSSIGI